MITKEIGEKQVIEIKREERTEYGKEGEVKEKKLGRRRKR